DLLHLAQLRDGAQFAGSCYTPHLGLHPTSLCVPPAVGGACSRVGSPLGAVLFGGFVTGQPSRASPRSARRAPCPAAPSKAAMGAANPQDEGADNLRAMEAARNYNEFLLQRILSAAGQPKGILDFGAGLGS